MLLSQEVAVKWHSFTYQHYINKGYKYTSMGEELIVKTIDLPKSSHAIVKIECDYCGNIFQKEYKEYTRINYTSKDSCRNCSQKRRLDTMEKKYGIKSFSNQKHVREKISKSNKLSKEYVQKVFESRDYKMLGDYVNSTTPINFICNKHPEEIQSIKLVVLQAGSGCHKCGLEKQSQCKRKYTFDIVKKDFEALNFTLLEKEYKSTTTPMKCYCNNHPDIIQYRKYENIKTGRKCKYCVSESRTRENHHAWNPNLTDEDRTLNRRYEDYISWRKLVFKRDNYLCQCCGAKGNIQAHHIFNYGDFSLLRTQIDNGTTLCERCHIDYHSEYGKSNNNPNQLLEFIISKRKLLSEIYSKNEQRKRFKKNIIRHLEKLNDYAQLKFTLL